MAFLKFKRIWPNRKRDAPVIDPKDYAIPRLVRKKKKSKKVALPKPQPVVPGIVLEDFRDPALPSITLRPATPPMQIFDVQERLFERSGAVFILRKEEASAHALSTQHLQVPSESSAVPVCGGLPPIEECDESEDSDDSGVGLDEDCEADYLTYVAAMDGEI
ncbi:hypothetical protein yc1106_06966 [Curvularia clavata]|uniref:Uncharacterized protein n=1 Tax=Curvularia clavata TaxID=95742 RepID=A0A9Q8ZAR1_CURCL|nr:hypothetical protein yc1106_06966 [Curvularia clavata]